MKNVVEAGLAIIIAFILYTILSKISLSLLQTFNVFSIIVICFAIIKGEIFGAFMGTFCGLIHDSFSLGVFGVSGLIETIIGFLAGYFSRKINVVSFFRSFTFIFIVAMADTVLSIILYSVIYPGSINMKGGLIFFQPLNTAFFGTFVLLLLRRIRSRNGE